MVVSHDSTSISAQDFARVLRCYQDVVPEKLAELEEQRLVVIPKALAARKPAHLTKDEVQTLVEWKLSHGTFRPSLKKLVASNPEQAIVESTRAAFALYADDHEKWDQAVAMLAKDLRGIGPATASLLLSVFDSENVPFFSDELFRWTMFEDGRGRGWDRKMNYSIKEYKQLYGLVQALRARLLAAEDTRIAALDAEKVAYVLGRQGGGGETVVGKKRVAADEVDVSGRGDAATNGAARRSSKRNKVPRSA